MSDTCGYCDGTGEATSGSSVGECAECGGLGVFPSLGVPSADQPLDLSRYEGHTPGPWVWTYGNTFDRASTDSLGRRTTTQICEDQPVNIDDYTYGRVSLWGPPGSAGSKYYPSLPEQIGESEEISNKSDARLIEDAPKILDECKRLREALQQIADGPCTVNPQHIARQALATQEETNDE